jgi:hypothetical protein
MLLYALAENMDYNEVNVDVKVEPAELKIYWGLYWEVF